MANLFNKVAKNYAAARPTYPSELFQFIASKTPRHDLAWDVGAGSGQATVVLAEIYKNVVATDTSAEQLGQAPALPNVRYVHTPANMSVDGTHHLVAPPLSVDLITVAQALHWFHLPTFYLQVRSVLRQPGGVLAVWCYLYPTVNPSVDKIFHRVYELSGPYWSPERRLVEEEYRGIEFPFDPIDGEASVGPFKFRSEMSMSLNAYLTYLRSWSAYQTAKEKGLELLTETTLREFAAAWGGDEHTDKLVTFPIFLKIGKV